MSGDRENPDRDFVCQSDPRTECAIPASRPGDPVFSDVHFYYHGGASETKYAGSVHIGFFEGQPESQTIAVAFTVKKGQSIANQSVANIVSSKPGAFPMKFDVMGTASETGKSQPIRDEISVVIK